MYESEATLLELCQNIKHVNMRPWFGPTVHAIRGNQLAWAMKSLRLESLQIREYSSIHLSPLLSGQPTLTTLQLPSFLDPLWLGDVPSTALPNLRCIEGDISSLKILVPDRSVEDMTVSFWRFVFRVPEDAPLFIDVHTPLLRALGNSTRPIKRLVLRLPSNTIFRPEHVSEFSELAVSIFKDVEELEIHTRLVDVCAVRLVPSAWVLELTPSSLWF
jgi:hypothetical protein